MNVRYRVELNQEERDQLIKMPRGGKHASRKLKRAQILLAADAGESDESIAANVAVGGSTVYRIKRRFVPGKLEAALGEAPRPGAERKLSSKQQAQRQTLAREIDARKPRATNPALASIGCSQPSERATGPVAGVVGIGLA
jgi:hypothetical protein